LPLQSLPVVRVHSPQHRLIDDAPFFFFEKWDRLLASAHLVSMIHVIEGPTASSVQNNPAVAGERTAGPWPSRRHAPHEHTIILRVDHLGSIAK